MQIFVKTLTGKTITLEVSVIFFSASCRVCIRPRNLDDNLFLEKLRQVKTRGFFRDVSLQVMLAVMYCCAL